jgi:hypothetical protein
MRWIAELVDLLLVTCVPNGPNDAVGTFSVHI